MFTMSKPREGKVQPPTPNSPPPCAVHAAEWRHETHVYIIGQPWAVGLGPAPGTYSPEE